MQDKTLPFNFRPDSPSINSGDLGKNESVDNSDLNQFLSAQVSCAIL